MNKQKTIIGIDVGGTKIHAGLFYADDFVLLEEKRVVTNHDHGFEEVLYQITQLVQDLRGKDTIAVGVGFPGYINHKTGMLYRTPNLPLEKPLNVLQYLRDAIDLPVAVENDAKLFTLAEYEKNWKHQVQHLVGLTLGTGLGGGLILNGELYRGRDGFAGEFGHVRFGLDHEFEDFVSGKGKRDELGIYLGTLLSNIIQVFNPEAIVLGGSVSNDFERVQKVVWETIRKRTLEQSSLNLKIEVSRLENPATIGAAMLSAHYFL